jgi:hypothetical protein
VCAKSNSRVTWCPFATALAAYQRGGWDGVLFALGDGWAAIDIDHYHRGTDWDHRFHAAGGYSERTPSGDGVRILGARRASAGNSNFTPT